MTTQYHPTIILLFISLLFNACQRDTPPIASFTYQEGYLFAKESIFFNSVTTNASSYEWDFGDGSVGYGNTKSHFYINPGTYTVTLTVKNATGMSHSTSRSIDIVDRLNPKTAKLKRAEVISYTNSWIVWDFIYDTSGLFNRPDMYYDLIESNTNITVATSSNDVIQDANLLRNWNFMPVITVIDLSKDYNFSIYDYDSPNSQELMFSCDFSLDNHIPATTMTLIDNAIDSANKVAIEVEWFY